MTLARPGAPAFQFGIEAGGALADLDGTDGLTAEMFDDAFGEAAGAFVVEELQNSVQKFRMV